jgi:hypothetical protein
LTIPQPALLVMVMYNHPSAIIAVQ